MKNHLFPLTLFILLTSCIRPTQTEQELREALNTTLNIAVFENVLHRDSLIAMQQLREKYSHLSVVYLQDGCSPCYPKFVEWHKKMEDMDNPTGHAILFVIRTERYDSFLQNVNELDSDIDKKHYVIIDSKYEYSNKNRRLPDWIINSSILIDKEDKIKMLGAPWINEDIKALFYKIVNS